MTDAAVPGYFHTQKAPWFLLLYTFGVLFLGVAWPVRGGPVACVVFPVAGTFMLLLGASFQHLTVTDEGDRLAIRFGPLPLFQRRIRYKDVEKVEVGRTTVLDGWGIHMSLRGGWVWNIWGRDCVVIDLQRGTLRVGTDDPEILAQFLRTKVTEHSSRRGHVKSEGSSSHGETQERRRDHDPRRGPTRLRGHRGLVEGFCRQHLNDEYAALCRKLTEKLARKRPSPLLSGKPRRGPADRPHDRLGQLPRRQRQNPTHEADRHRQGVRGRREHWPRKVEDDPHHAEDPPVRLALAPAESDGQLLDHLDAGRERPADGHPPCATERRRSPSRRG